ncbi:MAG: hypothetical protein F9K46_06585 [Anaerolineae bacterium]|nr:MAG: hypothetical protein F9K46_06585 [Anaerolineae bacterium]
MQKTLDASKFQFPEALALLLGCTILAVYCNKAVPIVTTIQRDVRFGGVYYNYDGGVRCTKIKRCASKKRSCRLAVLPPPEIQSRKT